MAQTLGYVALMVRDYDEAIAFFTQKLGFELVEDSVATDRLGHEKRWVLAAPPHSHATKLLLALAVVYWERSSKSPSSAAKSFPTE
jgi:catechol 2,3-dioxygenase-like lactoylglutathione lyase family enzyme